MRIIIIRHAESEANVDKSIQQTKTDHKLDLSPRGDRQAKELGDFLDAYFDKSPPKGEVRMYVSPYTRTMHTAFHILGQTKKELWNPNTRDNDKTPIFFDANLMELNFGLFAGHNKETMQEMIKMNPGLAAFNENFEMFNDPKDGGGFLAHRPMGNSPAMVYMGCNLFMDRMMRAKANDGIQDFVIVTHGATAKCLTLALTGDNPLNYDTMPLPGNATATLIKTTPDIGKNENYGLIFNPETGLYLLDDPLEPIRHDLYAMYPEVVDKFPDFRDKYPHLKKGPG